MSVEAMVRNYCNLTVNDYDALPDDQLPTDAEFVFASMFRVCMVVSCDEFELLPDRLIRRFATCDSFVPVLMFREWIREENVNEIKHYVFKCFERFGNEDVNLDVYVSTPLNVISDVANGENYLENHRRFLTDYINISREFHLIMQ